MPAPSLYCHRHKSFLSLPVSLVNTSFVVVPTLLRSSPPLLVKPPHVHHSYVCASLLRATTHSACRTSHAANTSTTHTLPRSPLLHFGDILATFPGLDHCRCKVVSSNWKGVIIDPESSLQ
ncbi:hypothetical protein ACSQ67_019125 [Phaseolus vulgaris]